MIEDTVFGEHVRYVAERRKARPGMLRVPTVPGAVRGAQREGRMSDLHVQDRPRGGFPLGAHSVELGVCRVDSSLSVWEPGASRQGLMSTVAALLVAHGPQDLGYR